jgi:hypothetical protein
MGTRFAHNGHHQVISQKNLKKLVLIVQIRQFISIIILINLNNLLH